MPDPLQQNGRIKRKFTTLFNRAYKMLNGWNVSSFLRNDLWAETVNTDTLLENNLLIPMRDLSSLKPFWGMARETS